MFEKEAVEWVKTKGTDAMTCLKENIGWDDVCEQAFKDGAKFAYNKANEWQYPSKGKYPKECENVWCYCKGLIKFCCVGHITVGDDNKIRWIANNKFGELCVIAWKEIVLPKESE